MCATIPPHSGSPAGAYNPGKTASLRDNRYTALLNWPAMFGRIAFILVVLATLLAGASDQVVGIHPAQGIIYREEISANPPLRVHIAVVDLRNPRVQVKVSMGNKPADIQPPWELAIMTVGAMAQRDGLDLAVNGNIFTGKDRRAILDGQYPYFTGNWARCIGYVMSDGVLAAEHPAEYFFPAVVVDRAGHVRMESFHQPPKDAWQIVGGRNWLVQKGRNVATAANHTSNLDAQIPCTAVGLNADATQMVLVVVDGKRQQFSRGMTSSELADEMLKLGCHTAIDLDGGGSSTMVLRDRVNGLTLMNDPSDGRVLPIDIPVQRAVYSALGVKVER